MRREARAARTLLAAFSIAAAGFAWGQASEVDRPDAATEARLKSLAEELRCLVCQNQTIADSHAPLALDLRNQIRTQIGEGRTDAQIRDYMVERYGDFVLYRPPLRATTVLLWGGPFLLLLAGAGVFVLMVRRRRPASEAGPAELSAERRGTLEALLEGREATTTSAGRPSGKR
jgi:cytochrome c-type biogenesis protein CcmH